MTRKDLKKRNFQECMSREGRHGEAQILGEREAWNGVVAFGGMVVKDKTTIAGKK